MSDDIPASLIKLNNYLDLFETLIKGESKKRQDRLERENKRAFDALTEIHRYLVRDDYTLARRACYRAFGDIEKIKMGLPLTELEQTEEPTSPVEPTL